MKPYKLQAVYRLLRNHTLRTGAIRAARGLGVRYLMLRVDTNDICNLRCPKCYMSNPNRVALAKPISRENFERIASQLFPKTRFLYLSCGTEPLATPNFHELLDITGRYKIPFTSYCTNGLLLRDRFIDATLRNRISEVIISVDGATKEVYEAIRVGGRFDKLEQRLLTLTRKMAAHRGPRPEIRFNFTAQKENVAQMLDFVEWARQWNPATLQFRLFRPLGGALKQSDDRSTAHEYTRRLPEVRRLCAAYGFDVETSAATEEGRERSVAELMAEAAATTATASPTTAPATQPPDTDDGSPTRTPINCTLPWFTMYVLANGDVKPCSPHPPIGNIFSMTAQEIDRDEPMTDLRRSLRACPKDICISCQRTGASGVL